MKVILGEGQRPQQVPVRQLPVGTVFSVGTASKALYYAYVVAADGAGAFCVNDSRVYAFDLHRQFADRTDYEVYPRAQVVLNP